MIQYRDQKSLHVSHFVGLKGLGGVQKNFTEYINYLQSNPGLIKHKVYTIGETDHQYNLEIETFDIKKISNLKCLIKDLISNDVIVHFYNNLSSIKVAVLLSLLPIRMLIIHERGTAWNQSARRGFITRFNSNKAGLILANSKATKAMLVKKFFISNKKIHIIYNGVSFPENIKKRFYSGNDNKFVVGFIGRLDTPKGVHILIDAIKQIEDSNIELVIAGDGPLKNVLRDQADRSSNISFVGRKNNPYLFLNSIDMLIVPSIREPLGNVCIEAGFCNIPVIASNIDGIPEIIENKISGVLISPQKKLTMATTHNSLQFPEFVINPKTMELQVPMQIDSKELACSILDLYKNPSLCIKYGSNLKKKVVESFTIERYSMELDQIYLDLLRTK